MLCERRSISAIKEIQSYRFDALAMLQLFSWLDGEILAETSNLPSIDGTVKSPSQKVTHTLADVSEFVIQDRCTIGERVFTCYVSPTGLHGLALQRGLPLDRPDSLLRVVREEPVVQGYPLLLSLAKLKHHAVQGGRSLVNLRCLVHDLPVGPADSRRRRYLGCRRGSHCSRSRLSRCPVFPTHRSATPGRSGC
jgi:hypothetical protein